MDDPTIFFLKYSEIIYYNIVMLYIIVRHAYECITI